MYYPRLVLAGTHSGAGKTTLSTAVMAAFTRQGIAVQPYKVGPDYIDPAFHTAVTGRISRNLDSWLLTEDTTRHLFIRSALGRGLGLNIIEGVMGLFDGQGTSHAGSTAHIAEILNAPVILAVNGQGMSRSAAALIRGYRDFSPDLCLAGVIFNRVSAKHYSLLADVVTAETGLPCFGYLPKNSAVALPERHLGLVPKNEIPDFASHLVSLADMATDFLDLTAIAELAKNAPPLTPQTPEAPNLIQSPLLQVKGTFPLRLGVARDAAFHFYYQDNLELLQSLGAELVFFSPLEDAQLPPGLQGLYFGGGFPEIFAHQLAQNTPLLAQIRTALEDNLPAYAECGGLMYLCESLVDIAGVAHSMVGFFPERTEMTKGLQRFGYAEITFSCNNILGPASTVIRSHEFHHSRLLSPNLEHCAPNTSMAFRVRKPNGPEWPGGLYKKQTLAGYPHLHFHSNPLVAEHFLNSCRREI